MSKTMTDDLIKKRTNEDQNTNMQIKLTNKSIN